MEICSKIYLEGEPANVIINGKYFKNKFKGHSHNSSNTNILWYAYGVLKKVKQKLNLDKFLERGIF